MHLLLSGSGLFAVGRIVPRLQRIDIGVQIFQSEDPLALDYGTWIWRLPWAISTIRR